MGHTLSPTSHTLPTVDEFLSSDSRLFAYTVVDGDGNPVDITNASVTWALYERDYQDDPSVAVLSDGDSSVEVVTDSRVDAANGEYEVRLDAGALGGEWGVYFQRPRVEQADGTVASWLGAVVIEP